MEADRFTERALRAAYLEDPPPRVWWPVRRWAYRRARRFAAFPDRRHLQEQVLPAVRDAGFARVLSVGCGNYTHHYGRWFEGSATELWTLDVDPRVAKWGETGRHRTASVVEADRHFPDEHFGAVLLNGVLGWGLDAVDDMNRAAAALAAVLEPRGPLLVGWNRGRCPDPRTLEGFERHFRPGPALGLEERTEFPGSTHVYDWFHKL